MSERPRPSLEDPETYAVIGAAMEVHRVMGTGFLEAAYRASLTCEFRLRGIPFASEVTFALTYKHEPLLLHYRVDFLCYEAIVVEVKAVTALGPREHAQTLNYLRASRYHRALVLNFGATSLQHRRIVCG